MNCVALLYPQPDTLGKSIPSRIHLYTYTSQEFVSVRCVITASIALQLYMKHVRELPTYPIMLHYYARPRCTGTPTHLLKLHFFCYAPIHVCIIHHACAILLLTVFSFSNRSLLAWNAASRQAWIPTLESVYVLTLVRGTYQ
jgi:hypothetical protein